MPVFYPALKLFAWYTCNLFFRDINVVNAQHIPEEGPVIVFGNHNNQFVDGMLLMTILKRPISFIAAAVSCRRPILGKLIRGTGAIPVQRPQDVARLGKGKIVEIRSKVIVGEGTQFTSINIGELISLKDKGQFRVASIVSDNQLITDSKCQDFLFDEPSAFKIIPKLEFHDLYESVWSKLRDGNVIGIYPQGGSHDRLQVLPLKAGICIMALGAMQKYGVPVKLVPAGFNYYNPQQFRSKVIVQFGPAYTIPQELVDLYKVDKRKAISILLQNCQHMLKLQTTEFKEYNELSALFMCRTLYTLNSNQELSIKEILDLNRRFARGYQIAIQRPQYAAFRKQVLAFDQMVRLSGMPLRKEDYFSNFFLDAIRCIVYLEKCIFRTIVALPGLIMMGPTTTIITIMAEKERLRCLKGSKVKLFGNDVVGSYKIMIGSVLLPLTAVVHSVLMYFALGKWTKLENKTKLQICLGLFALQPIYALLFVKSYDSLFRSYKKLKYFFARLFKKSTYNNFNREKKEIQKKILMMVEKIGEQVVPNFEQNRILKKSNIVSPHSSLYIFDEQENQA